MSKTQAWPRRHGRNLALIIVGLVVLGMATTPLRSLAERMAASERRGQRDAKDQHHRDRLLYTETLHQRLMNATVAPSGDPVELEEPALFAFARARESITRGEWAEAEQHIAAGESYAATGEYPATYLTLPGWSRSLPYRPPTDPR